MNGLITYNNSPDGVRIFLDYGAKANLRELLEMIDLDDFGMDAEDRADLAETRLQLLGALGGL